MPCRALEAFGRSVAACACLVALSEGLNALSGIGGVWTRFQAYHVRVIQEYVLMPCRALEAFGPSQVLSLFPLISIVLMPCRALEAFGRLSALDATSGVAATS